MTIDFAHDQSLLGYRELKLLNASEDPTFLRTPLFLTLDMTLLNNDGYWNDGSDLNP